MRTALQMLTALSLAAALGACTQAAPQHSGAGAGPTQAPPTATASPPTSPAAGTNATGSVPSQKPLPVDSSVPGDIPDTIQFVGYHSDAGHFTIRYPEGWAQQSGASSVNFTGTLNTVSVTWMPAGAAPTLAGATTQDVAQLQQTELAFQLGKVTTVALPAGPAIEITYQSNSAPNAVTGKQYRLDVVRYELWKAGTEAIVTLSSPAGADNVDPWSTVAKSFAWQ